MAAQVEELSTGKEGAGAAWAEARLLRARVQARYPCGSSPTPTTVLDFQFPAVRDCFMFYYGYRRWMPSSLDYT